MPLVVSVTIAAISCACVAWCALLLLNGRFGLQEQKLLAEMAAQERSAGSAGPDNGAGAAASDGDALDSLDAFMTEVETRLDSDTVRLCYLFTAE